MYFANPIGLIALAALPVIVAIHYFRRRFHPLRTAGLFLWHDPVRTRPAGRRFDRLPVSTSLLLELLAATLLAMLLADLRIGRPQLVEHLVVVLDDSASMSAAAPGQVGVRDQAVAEVCDRAGRLDRDARLTVLASGTPPRAIVGPAAPAGDGSAVAAAMGEYRPSLPDHALDPALALARQIAGPDARVVLITDRLPADPADASDVETVALGTPTGNVALVGGRRDADPDSPGASRCFIHLANFSDRSAETELVVAPVAAAGEPAAPLARETVALSPHGQWRRALPLPAGTGAVRVKLSDDGLSADNELVLAPPATKILRYRVELPPGPLADAVARAMRAIRDTRAAEAGEPVHLRITGPPEATDPTPSAEPTLPAGPTLSAGPAPSAGLAESASSAWRLCLGPLPRHGDRPRAAVASSQPADAPLNTDGPFVVARPHPLTRDVTFDGVILGQIADSAGWSLSPVISAGDRIVLGRLGRAGPPTWAFNGDLAPTRSTLVHAVDWVILLSNLAELRREELPGLEQRNFRLGQEVRIPLGRPIPPDAPLTLLGPAGRSLTPPQLAGSRELILDASTLSRPGLYELRDGGGQQIEQFAVNLLDERESDLSPTATGRAGQQAGRPGQLLTTDAPAAALPLLALSLLTALALLGNWFYLSRRGQ